MKSDFQEFKKGLMSRIAADIRRVGHSVMGILPLKDDPNRHIPFFYTVGRHSKHLPELLLVAKLSGEQGMDIANAVAALQGTSGFMQGQLVPLGGKYPVLIIDAVDPAVKEEYTRCVHAFYGVDDYRVQQIILPDREGRFPPECDAPYNAQPLFGEMPHGHPHV
jgi:hypothetical protein